MRKFYALCASLLVAFALLTGCQSQKDSEQENANASQEEKQEVSVHLEISQNNGEKSLSNKDFSVEKGTMLMEALKENFNVEENDGYITSIEGVKADESKKQAWMYTINGEEASVGADQYELKEGDKVVFDMHKWE